MKPKPEYSQCHEILEHRIPSRNVAEAFKIKVCQPMARTDGSERFPVLYVTDSDYFFGGFANLANMMQGYGETPRFILVGIGYENAGAAAVLRMRDLFSHEIQAHFADYRQRVADSDFVAGNEAMPISPTTDAADFLRFIREELMPFINARYPTLPEDSSYSGYSAGGTFGLYTLFTQPDTFRRYNIGSPATSFKGKHFIIPLAEAYLQSGRSVDATVFMSVGEFEELEPKTSHFDLVTGYYLLAKFLKRSSIAGLDLTLELFPGETHATAWTLAFSRGLKSVFGPADRVPFWPEDLK